MDGQKRGGNGWWVAVVAAGCVLGCAWPVVVGLIGGMAVATMPSFSAWVVVPAVFAGSVVVGLVALWMSRRRGCGCQESCATNPHAEAERS